MTVSTFSRKSRSKAPFICNVDEFVTVTEAKNVLWGLSGRKEWTIFLDYYKNVLLVAYRSMSFGDLPQIGTWKELAERIPTIGPLPDNSQAPVKHPFVWGPNRIRDSDLCVSRCALDTWQEMRYAASLPANSYARRLGTGRCRPDRNSESFVSLFANWPPPATKENAADLKAA